MTSQFTIESHLRLISRVTQALLFESEEALPAEEALLAAMDALPPGGLVTLDFSKLRVSSEAARTILGRTLRRLRSGEIEDRYLVLMNLGSSRYNVDVMLQGEDLVVAERGGPGAEARLLGAVEPTLQQTYSAVTSREVTTAADLRDALQLNSTQAATNRLAALARRGLARRVAVRSLEGGGREHVYSAVK